MSNLFDEELVPFGKGVRSLPGRPHISTGYRYALQGFRGIILETVLSGGRRYTSREALRRFVTAVMAAAASAREAVPATPVARPASARVDEAIEEALDESGI